MKLVDLGEKRKEKRRKRKTDQPDKLYSVRYAFGGKNWTFDIYAKSMREAQRRVHAIQHFPVEIAEIVAVID